MRDFMKSMLRFSWGMSLFSVQQFANLLTPQTPDQLTHKATAAFNSMTQMTEEQLSDTLKGAFKAGARLQKSMVDVTSSFLTLEAFNPSRWIKLTSDIMQQSTDSVR